jgi:hypothetical protein
MKKFYAVICALLLFSLKNYAQVYSENFDGVGATVASGVFSSGTGQPTLNTNLSVANNWTGYDHSGNLTTASDVANFCSSGKGLRGYVIPNISSSRKFKLVLTVETGYIFNMTSISYKHTSNINNGSSTVTVNGAAYGNNFLIQQSCPGQTVTFTQNIALTNQVTLELFAGNSGTINNAEFTFDDFTINGSVDFTANNEFIQKSCIGTATGVEARLGNTRIADFDGNNDKDIIVTDDASNLKLYKNNGNGTFAASMTLFTSAGSTAVGDLDGDNDMDLAQSDGKVYLNNGSGVFTRLGTGLFRTAGLYIQNVEIADFNNDGKKDLLWLNGAGAAGENNEIWLNTGTTGNPSFTLTSTFNNVGVGPATYAAIGDIDGDNDLDIITCSTGGWSGRIYKNNGSGSFTISQTLSSYTGKGYLLDWDGDGARDFLAFDTYNNGGLRLWKNDGTGTFGTVSSGSLIPLPLPQHLDIADLNGDTYLDVICGIGSGAYYYLNSGCGLNVASQTLGNAQHGVVVADFNNDGKRDIFCAARDATSCIYTNYLTTAAYVPLPSPPSVSSPINYTQNATATALTVTGSNLKWYDAATGGNLLATTPTPSTTTVGTFSYWVSQTNANGCESDRAKIDVIVSGSCLGGAGSQARLYSPQSADFDGDNDKDIIVLDEGGAYWLNKNDGTGKFTAQQILNGLTWSTLVWKDLDGDGDIDLVSTAGKIFLNNGTGTFTQLAGTFWTATGTINAVRIADFNKDGKQDILWLNSNMAAGFNNQVWLNSGTTGNPNFTLGSEFDNTGVGNNGGSVIGDIDNDGDMDLIACSGGGWNGKVFKNNGSGVFTSSQTLATYTGTGFIVDWDKDGDNDFLAYDNYNNWGLKVWTNDGTGTFSAPSVSSLIVTTTGTVTQIVDLNGDTYLDVVCASGSGARYYLNTGCALVLNTHVLGNANNGAIADDFNKDGKQDIFCAARDAQSCVNLMAIPSTYLPITPPSVTTPVTYCQNATATALTATGTNLKWYTAATGGTGNTTAPTPSTTTAGTTSYWVTSTNANGCESERVKIDVTINALPATPSVSTPVTYCQNATATALTATGTNLKWYTAATGGTSSTTAPTPSTTTAGTTSYWVSQTVNGCESARTKIDVTINATPATPSITTPISYCQNATVSALTATGTNLKWYTAATGGTGNTTAPTPSTTTAGTTSYWVSQTNANGCESERAKIDVTINAKPSAPSVITPNNYAQGATASALVATGSNLLWYTAATGGTGSTTAPTPSTATLGTTSYWVSQTVNGCESVRAKIDVTVSSTTNATHLNFSNSYVNIGNLIPTGSSYTKELWIKPNSVAGNNMMSSSTSAFWFYNNDLQCGHGGGFRDVFANASSMVNTWTHVAVTYDNATTTMKLYVNGNMVSQNTNVAAYTGAAIQIGAFINGATFSGDMDEARLWNKALTAEDILRRKNCELQGNEAGLIAYYKFNQGFDASTNTAVTSLTDATTNGNNGTLNGFALTGATSNWLAGSPVTTGSSIPSAPSVTTPVAYCQNATATALTATGTSLKWYTAATGGTGSTTAPTPSTTTAGTISYWVVSSNANGCESERVKIDVIINTTPATPSVSTPVTYCENATATALTASGSNLKWYTAATGGTSNTTAPTPSTATAGTTSYWVSQTVNGCESDRVKIDVTVNTTPAPSASNQSFCGSATVADLTATGTAIKWYATATGGTALAPTTALSNGTTYYASQTLAGCESTTRVSVLVSLSTFNSPPTLTTPVLYCQNATATALTATGTNLKWYTTGTGGTGNTNATTPSTTTVGTTSYWVSSSNANGCESNRIKIDVTINPLTSAPTASNQSFCVSATVANLTAVGTNIKWYAAQTGGTALVSTAALTTGTTYYASQTNANGCESSRTAVVVTINATLSTPSVSTPVLYCQNATATALIASGSKLKWYSSETGGTGNTTVPTPSTTTVGTTSYWVSQSLNGCESDRVKIDVTVNARPAVPTATTPIVYCQNTTASALTAIGTSLKWYTAATGGTGNTTAPTPITTTVGTTSYWVSQTNANGCESDRTKIDITINALPTTPSVSTPISYCQNATASALTATGSNLKWYTTATGGTSSVTAPTPSTATAGTTSYWVSQTNANGCESARAKIDININASPTEPNISEPALSYCQGSVIPKLTATVATGTTVDWYSAATNGLLLQGSSATLTVSQAGTYYAQARNTSTGCVNSQRTVGTITMNATPVTTVISQSTLSYCQGNTIPSLAATVATGITVDWYSAPTSGTMVQGTAVTFTPPQAGTYYAQSRDITTGCVSSQRTMGTITMNTLPVTPNISQPALSYCEGKPVPSLTATVATGETVDWYSAASSGTMVQSAQTIFTPSVAGTYYAQSRNITTGCVSSQRSTGAITMNALPLAPVTSSPAHICEGRPMPTLIAQVQTGETVDWYNSASGGDLFLKGSLTYTPTFLGTYYAEARNISTGCVSATRVADTIRIDPIPQKPIVNALISYCVGANAPILTATGSNLKWYSAASGGTGNVTAPQPNTSQEGSTSYYVTQTTGNNCESPRSKIDITTESFKNTLPKQRTLCKDQYFEFNLKNNAYPNLTHSWTSSNGYSSNKERDTLRNAGSYYVETLTALGCKSKDTITLSVDTTTIESNFAVATELVTVDIIKVVNISNTQNDSVRWIVPNGLKIVGNTPTLLELVANDTGSYKLGLITYRGTCSATSYQDVTIYTKTFGQTNNDSLYFVKTFTAFPNPSKGENVTVKIELSKESSVRLRLIDMSTNQIINDRTLSKADTYSVDYGSGLKKGSYVLFLESPYGRNVLKLVIF